MNNWISYLLVAFASIFKSLSDTLQHHFWVSVFKKLKPEFWDPNISWNKATLVFNYKLDAWHLSNSAMQLCWILAILFYKPKTTTFFNVSPKVYSCWVDFIGFSLVNILTFNLFYNQIFK